ncbi:cell wall hydrolase [Planktotalea sp.]|uniref:cell wall hydrolase n=1 Tax=Planktotalea sp. TaxID=2029877 RepID=UPI003D6A9546
MQKSNGIRLTIVALCAFAALAGCAKRSKAPEVASKAELDCMARAMYFESNRSSRDGMVAVGSVVMNRVDSDAFPDTVCGVVSQKNQFAPGVMTRSMELHTAPLITGAAKSVYHGERHPRIANAKFFHAAWYKANFNNMHYVLTTGGNAFYEKRRPEKVTSRTPVPATEGLTAQ